MALLSRALLLLPSKPFANRVKLWSTPILDHYNLLTIKLETCKKSAHAAALLGLAKVDQLRYLMRKYDIDRLIGAG